MSSHRLWHWTMGGALGLLLTIGLAPSSQAASILSSNPSDGSVVHVAPTQVTITADGALVEMGTSLVVSGEDGVRVDDGSVQVNGPTALVGVQQLRKAGRYTVTYQLIFGDGQSLNGSYNFTFSGSGPEKPSPTPTTIGTPPPVAHSTFFENLKRGGIGLLLAMLVLLVIGSRVAGSRRNRE
jgi:methionine-rich copper-binding protein CopC